MVPGSLVQSQPAAQGKLRSITSLSNTGGVACGAPSHLFFEGVQKIWLRVWPCSTQCGVQQLDVDIDASYHGDKV